MINQTVILLITTLIVSLLPGCGDREIPGEVREPRCNARSNLDPARLKFDTGADNYGVIEPCEGFFEAFITKNTELKTVEMQLEFMNSTQEKVHKDMLNIELEEAGFGTLHKKITIKAIDGEVCKDLTLSIKNVVCKTENGKNMNCPDVSLVTSYSFYDVMIEDDNLNVCYTNI